MFHFDAVPAAHIGPQIIAVVTATVVVVGVRRRHGHREIGQQAQLGIVTPFSRVAARGLDIQVRTGVRVVHLHGL